MTYEPIYEDFLHSGVQKVYRFDNKWGASVIQHEYSYGGKDGRWEIGLIKFDGPKWDDFHLESVTDFIDEVVGYLTDKEVEEYLEKIEKLPAE